MPGVSFAAGIVAGAALRFSLVELAAGGLALSLVAYLAFRKARQLTWLPTCVLFVIAGAFAYTAHRPPDPPQLDAGEGDILLVSGCVVEPPSIEGPRLRLVLELEPKARVRLSLNAREGETLPAVSYGELVEVEARVRKPRNFQNPGAFDYVWSLRRQDIHWTASARGVDKLHRLPGTCGQPVERAAFAVRAWLAERLHRIYRQDDYAARLTPALLLGDNAALERSWTEDFRRTGTYHALVISGLHITVVAGATLFLLRVAGMPLLPTLFLSALLAWGYAAIANWQAPVVRSAAGFTLFLCARACFRKGRLLNLLGATALVFLACDPDQLFEPSFQLTFLSVAAIGALASPLIERSFGPLASGMRALHEPSHDLGMEDRVAQFRIELRLLAVTAALWTRIPVRFITVTLSWVLRCLYWVLEMVAISLCVQLCLGLALIVYFHQLSATSIPANVLVVPLLTIAVPVALLAALTGWQWLAVAAIWLVRSGGAAASWFAAWEPNWRIPSPPLWIALLLALTVAALAIAALSRARWRWVSAGVVASLVSYSVVAIYPFEPERYANSLELTAIDVGQGESLLVGLPDGRFLLMDGGGIPSFDPRIKPKLDIGEDVVSPYLWHRRIRQLDIVAISHLHDDHVAGLPAVIRNFRPREIWMGAAPDSPQLRSIESAAQAVGARIVHLAAGSSRPLGKVKINVLAPRSDYVPGRAPANDDSLILSMHFGRHHFLLTGDAGPAVERGLLANGAPEEVDVLKIAHHGSRLSTIPDFVDAVQPLFAVVSAGAGNTYGHPHPDVMRRLYGAGARVMRTDVQGLSTISSDGYRITVASGGSDRSASAFQEKLSQ